MATAPLDELFGQGVGQPKPRRALVAALLSVGMLLEALGLACSVVPGVVLVLIAWSVVETEKDRIASGFLPKEAEGSVRLLHAATVLAIVLSIGLLIAQGVLIGIGLYHALWEGTLMWILRS